ncbi:MAG: hypothetical protein WBW16_15545 [Bacteroidota bacterium]
MARPSLVRLGKILVLFAICVSIVLQALTSAQPLPKNPEWANVFLRGLIKEAEHRKQERYALIRAAHADVAFSAVQSDVLGAVAAYLRFVGIREFYLPRKPVGFYIGRGTPADFRKYPEDQDVYIDPWLPEARKPSSN